GSFVPPPKVDSAVVKIVPLPQPREEIGDEAHFGHVVHAAFGQRRKTLRNSLRSLGLDAAGAEALGRAAGVDLGLRGERLDVDAFAALTRALAHQVRSPF
ncbi:MAG: rRNA adenine N-6-methyltransferase family protein, partial [Actinomycetes bacterium]